MGIFGESNGDNVKNVLHIDNSNELKVQSQDILVVLIIIAILLLILVVLRIVSMIKKSTKRQATRDQVLLQRLPQDQ